MTEDIVARTLSILMIPPEVEEPPVEDIVVRTLSILMIPEEEEPPPDGVIPPDWQAWIEENWEVIAAVLVAIIIIGIILMARR